MILPPAELARSSAAPNEGKIVQNMEKLLEFDRIFDILVILPPAELRIWRSRIRVYIYVVLVSVLYGSEHSGKHTQIHTHTLIWRNS